jgi:hypothetical protein
MKIIKGLILFFKRCNCIVLIVTCIVGCNSIDYNKVEIELPETVDFNFHIKPILSDRCFTCHGPDDKARKGDLRLDKKNEAFKKLAESNNHFIIKPGKLKKSELYQRIVSDDSQYKMPPPESNLDLSEYEIALFKRWIEQGAEWKPHWAFIKPQKTGPPETIRKDWALNEIDHFVLNRLEILNQHPSVKARKEKLLRKVSFDLTGLPPNPEILNRFLRDNSENAYESMVDELLESKGYGERMATEWMDLARYAETNGYHHDFERNMWPWRDWVIKSFNNNIPYDQFVTWQLAGDLLPDPTYEQQLATAFNRNNRTTQECGSLDEEFRVSYVIDRTNTFGKAFLGLTVECSQCHDHKYDPISQKEYYQLSAFFNQVPEKGVTKSFGGQPEPYLEMPEEEVLRVKKYIKEQIAGEYRGGSEQDKEQAYKSNWEEEMGALSEPVMIMKDLDTLRPTYILDRGLYDAPGELVSHATPKSILEFKDEFSSDRLGLSEWLFDSENPLTARVAVNRYWQMIFGRGLVTTPDDFGNQGSLPSHPDLLDWLSVEFIDSGWDVKHLLKLMVTSATYQQASKTDSVQIAFDPDNKWLARGNQQRLTAEMIRDQSLSISGLLNEQIGGPSVKPYQPEGLWTQVSSGGRYKRKYMNAQGEDLYRRSLYTYWKRIQPPPSMVIFDAGRRNICTVERQSTNTPLQALVLLNDPQFLAASTALAIRMINEGGTISKDRIHYAFRMATSRDPDSNEIEILEGLLQKEKNEFEAFPNRAEAFVKSVQIPDQENFDKIELASYAMVANAIINLSESMQKN